MDSPSYLLEAVKLIKDWAIWVTGIQTGAIAVLGSLVKDGVPRIARKWVIRTLISFLLSILVAVWLVLLLPSVTEQLYNSSAQGSKEIYDIYPRLLHRPVPFRLGLIATVMHLGFMLGIICFAMFVYKRATTGSLSN